ncbi:MAG: hypothetical protein ABTQ25_08370 [Nitrosomonas ureae]
MKQNETNVWKRIQLFVSPLGHRLLRNQRYKGPIVRNGKVTDAWADCGVGGDGGADLLGWRSFIIQPHHVGKRIAQFFAVETKVKDKKGSVEQENFISAVRNAGGIAGIARSEEDTKKIMDDW